MRALLFSLILILAAPSLAQAKELSAVQGQVIRISKQTSHPVLSVRALKKNWPVKVDASGNATAWVGIDLSTPPGRYAIKWSSPSGWSEQDSLEVTKGEFRISHITVEKKMAVFDKKTLARIRSDQANLRATYTAKVNATPDIAIAAMPTEGIISTPFGAQRYVNGEPRSPHSGIDIAAPEGTPVVTPLAGKVLLVSDMYLNGNTVVIGHGFGVVSVYCHLQESLVKKGDWIEQNSRIGSVGMSGRSTGPHLHWGIRFNQARIDPLSILSSEKKAL